MEPTREGWLQRPDFAVEEWGHVDLADALARFHATDWNALREMLDRFGEDCCPPNVGFVDGADTTMTIAALGDETRWWVYLRVPKGRSILGLIPVSYIVDAQGVSKEEMLEAIRLFFCHPAAELPGVFDRWR